MNAQQPIKLNEKWVDKYRPKSYKDFVGIDATLTALEGFILSGNMPHCLFYGEKGTGKTATAEVTALKILGGDNSNFIELNASDEREEKDVRGLIKKLRCQPLFSDVRVVLWDEFNLKPNAQELIKRPMEKLRNTIFIITGKAIADSYGNIQRFDERTYAVKSQVGYGYYAVTLTEIGWKCSCPDHTTTVNTDSRHPTTFILT